MQDGKPEGGKGSDVAIMGREIYQPRRKLTGAQLRKLKKKKD